MAWRVMNAMSVSSVNNVVLLNRLLTLALSPAATGAKRGESVEEEREGKCVERANNVRDFFRFIFLVFFTGAHKANKEVCSAGGSLLDSSFVSFVCFGWFFMFVGLLSEMV